MRMRLIIPLAVALGAFGCGTRQMPTAPLLEPGALRASAAPSADLGASGNGPGAVYTMTNSAAGNAVLAYTRAADGTLDGPESFPTNGTGTGSGLGNQGALALGDGGRWLFVVNAGSNSVSSFHVGHAGLALTDVVPSGGDRPVSVTVHHDLLYVLNAGGTGNIQGFRIAPNGELSPIAGSNRPLSGAAVAAAQIGFTPDGSRLVVSERATNLFSIYEVAADGSATGPTAQPSAGTTPFGFGFDQNETLIVSEAFGGAVNGSAVSSYDVGQGAFAVTSPSVPTTETAACWVAVSGNGRFSYAANAGSASITGYAVANEGSITRLDVDGVTATTGAGPTDLALSAGSRFLYVICNGSHTIDGYAVGADGSLEPLASPATIPNGVNGIVAR